MTEWAILLVLLAGDAPPDYRLARPSFTSEEQCDRAGFVFATERWERTRQLTRWTCYPTERKKR